MPTLAVNNFNIVLSVLGGWISLFGLVSYLLKENFYLSEACMCQFPFLFMNPLSFWGNRRGEGGDTWQLVPVAR